MRLDKLAVTAQEAFQNAMGVAGEADAAVIEPIHLLKALLDSDENNLAAIVKRIGADPVWLSQNVADEIAKMPKQTGATPMAIPGQDLIKVIDNSVKIAEKLGDSYATSEHLLIALSEDKGAAGRILTTAGVTRKNIEAAYESLRGDTRVTSQTDKTQFEALEQYGQNLTQQAREGKLDPVIGRNEEIRRTTLGEAEEYYRENPPKGEFVLVVRGAPPKREEEATLEDGQALVEELMAQGTSQRDAVKQAAKTLGLSRNQLYDAVVGK